MSIRQSLSIWQYSASIGGWREVKRHCTESAGHFMERTGPWRVHPNRVWAAAGPPGGPSLSGFTGVMSRDG